jgi:hypothetical protein
MTEDRLQDYMEKGLRPPKVVVHWRAPPAEHEEPQPEADEIVSFLMFHERSLGYPAHPFLPKLLNEWEVELQHLNPNGVLAGRETTRRTLPWTRTGGGMKNGSTLGTRRGTISRRSRGRAP